MAHSWKDPRSATDWVIEVTPFEAPPDAGDVAIPMGWQMMFVSGRNQSTILIALLDASRPPG